MALSRSREIAFTFLLGLVLRIALIVTNPIVLGGDSILRLFDRFTLVKAHQLPMLQVLIAILSPISMDASLVRYMLTLVGAAAGVGFYLLIEDLFGPSRAFPAALLFVTNPFVLAVSTSPYQEILMFAALFFAFHFFYRERWLAASLCLAIACLTRFEAWAACPLLFLAYVVRYDRSPAGWLKSALLFGWMPAVWILARHGLTGTGHFVVEPTLNFWRLQRWVYLGWVSVKFTQIPVVALAAAGGWRLWRRRTEVDWRLGIQFAFAAIFAVAILFSAHGVQPDPERYVTSREAHIPIYFLLLLAVIGLQQWPRWNRAIVASSVVLGVAGAFWYLHVENSQPEVQLAYQLARYLDRSVADGERAAILTKPVPPETARLYLEKARATGGEQGEREARLELESIEPWPPDYQRVVVHSRLGRDRLLSSLTPCASWVAVWSDYPGAAAVVAKAAPVDVLHAGSLSVSVFRRSCD